MQAIGEPLGVIKLVKFCEKISPRLSNSFSKAK